MLCEYCGNAEHALAPHLGCRQRLALARAEEEERELNLIAALADWEG